MSLTLIAHTLDGCPVIQVLHQALLDRDCCIVILPTPHLRFHPIKQQSALHSPDFSRKGVIDQKG